MPVAQGAPLATGAAQSPAPQRLVVQSEGRTQGAPTGLRQPLVAVAGPGPGPAPVVVVVVEGTWQVPPTQEPLPHSGLAEQLALTGAGAAHAPAAQLPDPH